MRSSTLWFNANWGIRPLQRSWVVSLPLRRRIHVNASPNSESRGDFLIDVTSDSADASFEVLGTSNSILSVSLSASQTLHTRRGTLIGICGKAENTRSTLSILEPFRRSLLGIPFLYQNISSITPITVLISTKSTINSFTALNINGTIDWMVAQPKSLIAWTGQSLGISPIIKRGMGALRLGKTKITGRGLIALAAPGNIYQITLGAGEEYVAHPNNVIAFTITQHSPKPYHLCNPRSRMISSSVSQVLSSDIKLVRTIRRYSFMWQWITRLFVKLRTLVNRALWGDQHFLKFSGPATILISSRTASIRDVLFTRDENEISEARSYSNTNTSPSIDKSDNQIPTGRQLSLDKDIKPVQS